MLTYEEEKLTLVTLGAASFDIVSVAVRPQVTNIREIWNETGGDVWFLYSNTAPTNTDQMRKIADGGFYLANKTTGMPVSKLYAYSVAGGKVKYVEA